MNRAVRTHLINTKGKVEYKFKVLMLGDSLIHKGGIATVEALIMQGDLSPFDITHIATHKDGSMIKKLQVFTEGLLVFICSLLVARVDLVHIHLADWGSVLRKAIITLIALLFRKPVVIHAHGPEFHLTYRSLPLLVRKGINAIFQQSASFIVLSEEWKKFYVSHLNLDENRVFVLPNPIEMPNVTSERATSQKLTAIFMGKIGERKGTFDLIRAFSELPCDCRQSLQLLVAGNGDLGKAEELIKQLNLSECVKLLGWIDAEQRSELLANSNIFILPSYNEALPMALLEAMSYGLPVITCPVGGIPDLILSHQNGLLVQPGDVHQLSLAIQTLANNEPLRRKLGDSAQSSVAPLDIENYLVKLKGIYYFCTADEK